MRFDICLEMVFTNLTTEERIEKIAKSGFDAIEFWFHDSTFDGATCATSLAKDAKSILQVCEANCVAINNMVVNAPDGSFGGSPVDANEYNKYIERVHEVIAYAKSVNCSMAITCTGNIVPGLSSDQMMANLEKAYSEAAKIAAAADFTLVVEPLNIHVDHAGYFMDSSAAAAELVRKIDSKNFRLLYDVYHMQIMEGNVIANIEKQLDIIGHFHSAGVPGRHELNDGELNYINIIKKIDALGYKGRFGLEYAPAMSDSSESLKEMKAYLSLVM